jgi:hypothetical protein
MLTPGDLELARKRVADGREPVGAQRRVVERLAATGHDTVVAESLLRNMQTTLAIMEQQRDKIEAALKGDQISN